MNNFLENITYIGHGKEGDIFQMGPFVIKSYRVHIPFGKMEREYNFLKKFRETGAVPKVYSNLDDLRELRAIIMEKIDDAITLKEFKKIKKEFTEAQLNTLIKKLARARYLIGPYTKYGDLHSDNVMIGFKDNKLTVKLIDPGRIDEHPGADIWIGWLQEMIKEIGLSRTKNGKIIKTGNINKIKALFEK